MAKAIMWLGLLLVSLVALAIAARMESSQDSRSELAIGSMGRQTTQTEKPSGARATLHDTALDQVVIDVMLLYTNRAAQNYKDIGKEVIEPSIQMANDSFQRSNMGHMKLRLVHSQLIDYDEADADQFDHLYRMVDGVGAFKSLEKLRDEKRADIVGLILNSLTACGLSTRVGADAEEAFFVVHHGCVVETYSVAHEIGHLLGARHTDAALDASYELRTQGQSIITFVMLRDPSEMIRDNGTNWRDIMSFAESCGGCPRVPLWVNPNALLKSEGDRGAEPEGRVLDNIRVMSARAPFVAAFR